MSVAKRMAAASKQQSSQSQKLSNSPALGEVAALAERQMSIEDEIDKLDAALKEKKRELEEVSTKLLPNAMTAVGMEEFKLTSGAKVSVSAFYSASIKDENKPKAFKWLRENGHEGLIKRDLTVPFQKGEDKKAEVLVEHLKKKHFIFSESSSVHTQTLKAWLRDQVESGVQVPLDLFGAFIGRKAKIKRP